MKPYVERYPCDCQDPGNPNAVCWIVRDHAPTPDVSYTTEYGARMRVRQILDNRGRTYYSGGHARRRRRPLRRKLPA